MAKQKENTAQQSAKGNSTMRRKNVKKYPSTQSQLYIAEIKNDTVVLKDGSLRAVLQVSSINFALKSSDEQQAIIQGYTSFLNTLDFEVQIVIQSRKLDIRPYLESLDVIAKNQTNELLKVQTEEYRQYISELVDLSDIMEKKFYVTVPYSPLRKKRKNFFSRAQEVILPGRVIKLNEAKFDKYREELGRRVGLVAGGLSGIGLEVSQLDTQALIALYYQMYNPTRGEARKLPNVETLQVDTTNA